jgi:hypothetical protein
MGLEDWLVYIDVLHLSGRISKAVFPVGFSMPVARNNAGEKQDRADGTVAMKPRSACG